MKSLEFRSILLGGAAMLLLTTSARAQGEFPYYSSPQLKSENTALKYSAASTVVPIAAGVLWWSLDSPEKVNYFDHYGGYIGSYHKEPDRTVPLLLISTGIMVGPSIGYFYGGRATRGMTGLCIRAGTAVLTAIVADAVANNQPDVFLAETFAGYAVGIAGSIVIIIESIYEIAAVRGAVREHNNEFIRHQGSSVTLFPVYFAQSETVGLGINVNF